MRFRLIDSIVLNNYVLCILKSVSSKSEERYSSGLFANRRTVAIKVIRRSRERVDNSSYCRAETACTCVGVRNGIWFRSVWTILLESPPPLPLYHRSAVLDDLRPVSLHWEAARASSTSSRLSRRILLEEETRVRGGTEKKRKGAAIVSRKHAALKDETPEVPTVAGSISPPSGWRGGCWSFRWPACWSTKRETKSWRRRISIWPRARRLSRQPRVASTPPARNSIAS